MNTNSSSRSRKKGTGVVKARVRFAFNAEQKAKIAASYADSLEYTAQGFDLNEIILDFINDIELIINNEPLPGE